MSKFFIYGSELKSLNANDTCAEFFTEKKWGVVVKKN